MMSLEVRICSSIVVVLYWHYTFVDTELENLSVVQTVINSATDRKNIVAFNYASEALNNSFFFANLKQEPSESSEPTGSLARHIEEQFGSIQEFKSHFGATANALTGGGYVWLVSDSNRRIGIVTTYGSGTILIRSRQQRGLWNTFSMIDNEPSSQQSNKLNNNQQSPLSSPTHSSKPTTPNTSNPLGTVREYSSLNFDSRNVAETGDVLTPLLCLSVFERCYLTDFGVWGREEYIKNFWKVVDWSKVEEAFDKLIARRVSL